jgi:hypothetical protein
LIKKKTTKKTTIGRAKKPLPKLFFLTSAVAFSALPMVVFHPIKKKQLLAGQKNNYWQG